MDYVFDASALVDAWNEWYAPIILPTLWEDDLIRLAERSIITVPDAVLLELEKHIDDLYRWCKDSEEILCNNSTGEIQEIVRDISNTYQNLSHGVVPSAKSFADPFVIATAHYYGCAVVTHESFSNNMNGPKIPDVCRDMKIRTVRFARFVREQNLQYG